MEMSKNMKAMLQPTDLTKLPIAMPKPAMPKVTMHIMNKKEEKAHVEEMKVIKLGGPASKLLPEMAKEDNKDERSATPLLSENDARCYAARYSDLKGAASLTHYATVGVP